MASLLVASVLFLLSSGTLATITVSDFIIDSTPFAGPFTANMSISDDLTIRLDFSTIGANPDNIIAVGPGSFSDGDTATRDFYASVEFHNSGPISEIWLGDWEMEGGLELDEGVTATVDVGAKLLGSYPPVRRIFSTTNPPSTPSFHGTLPPLQNASSSGYCSGLDPGKRTFAVSTLGIHFTFNLEKSSNATKEAAGRFGSHSQHAMAFKSRLEVRDGCSRQKPFCSVDRTGFELCSNF